MILILQKKLAFFYFLYSKLQKMSGEKSCMRFLKVFKKNESLEIKDFRKIIFL